jgi:hypothetical protein
MTACFVLALLVLPASCADDPPITLYQNVSNVYGRAFVNQSRGVVMYLGRFDTPKDCEEACFKYKGADGSICNSFSHHAANFPQADYKGACYAITDHSWSPVYNSALLVSGKIDWPKPKCGDGSSPGCEWEFDPVCLTTAGATVGNGSMTTDEALAACAKQSDCVGVTVKSKVANSTIAIPTFLTNKTDEVHGGGTGCWSYRKHYALAVDPYRTSFHFQPSAQWMNGSKFEHPEEFGAPICLLWFYFMCRSQRPHDLRRPLPPLLSVESLRQRGLRRHALGARRFQRYVLPVSRFVTDKSIFPRRYARLEAAPHRT